jgi:hypothetical protein
LDALGLRRSTVPGAGRARKTFVQCRGIYGDMKSPQICVMMIVEQERALGVPRGDFAKQTKPALGEGYSRLCSLDI